MTSFFLYANNKFCGKIPYYANCNLCYAINRKKSINKRGLCIYFVSRLFFQAIAVYERTVSLSSVSEVMSYWRVIAKKLENNCLLNPFNTGTAHFLLPRVN